MRSVWKWTVPVGDGLAETNMPVAARILHVAATPGNLGSVDVWAEKDLDDLTAGPRYFRVHGTGHPIYDEEERYVGTAIPAEVSGALVWHLYEVWPL